MANSGTGNAQELVQLAAPLPPSRPAAPLPAKHGTRVQALEDTDNDQLERALRKAIRSQRDTETKLQLALQRGAQTDAVAGRLLKDNAVLVAQIEDIRGRLLEAKLKTVRLTQAAALSTGGQRRGLGRAGAALACVRKARGCSGCVRQMCQHEDKCGLVALVVLVGAAAGMIVFFAFVMG